MVVAVWRAVDEPVDGGPEGGALKMPSGERECVCGSREASGGWNGRGRRALYCHRRCCARRKITLMLDLRYGKLTELSYNHWES